MAFFVSFLQDYKEAARIRDSLKLFEDEEPVLRLRRLLKEAIAEERFQVSNLLFEFCAGSILIFSSTLSIIIR